MTDTIVLLTLPPTIDTSVVPRWLTEKYPGMENDITEWFTSYFFWKAWDGKMDTIPEISAQARAIAEAKYKTLFQTNTLAGAAQRSVLLQLYEANETHWFEKVGEIADVNELLDEILKETIEKDPDGGARYEIEFILKVLIPTAVQLGIPKEKILAIPHAMTKARAAVANTRIYINNLADQPEELSKTLEKEIQDIADPSITVRTFKERTAERIGRTKAPLPPPVKGAVYLVAGSELIVIESDRVHTQAIQMATRGIVDELQISDATVLLKMLSQRIRPRANDLELMGIDYRNGQPVVVRGKGTLMPTQASYPQLALTEMAHQRVLVMQSLAHLECVYIPLHTIGQMLEVKEIENFIQRSFSFRSQMGHAMEEAEQAFSHLYREDKLPTEIHTLFPDIHIRPIVTYLGVGGIYGLFLEVYL